MMDQTALEDLKPGDLPSPPQAAIQIMRACSRDNISNVELSRIAGNDPVLAAELLRVANSPFFGLGREVQTITRAITVLGQHMLRNLALCLAVRDSLHSDGIEGFDGVEFWEDALLRAVGARLLGQKVGLDADECFTAGILQDFGLLVILHLNREQTGIWSNLRVQDPDARRIVEFEHFGMTHDAVSALLSRTWDLPDSLGTALGDHHRCDEEDPDPPVSRLARVLYAADWSAAVFRSQDKGYALRRYRETLKRHFNLGEPRADRLLANTPGQVEAAAAALGMKTRQALDFERIIEEVDGDTPARHDD